MKQIDSLLFIGARMIDCLATRAATHALSLASLTVQMQLDGNRLYQRAIRPALPTIDRKFLLKLLQLEIAAHPPQAAVLSLTLTAEAGQSSKVQLGLFAPQTPEPSRLDVTIARLKAIAGEDRVGSPVLEDTHRPGSFRMENFVNRLSHPVLSPSKLTTQPRLALRRMRPPVPVRVQLDALQAGRLSRSRTKLLKSLPPTGHGEQAAAGGPPTDGTPKSGTCSPKPQPARRLPAFWFTTARRTNGVWKPFMTEEFR